MINNRMRLWAYVVRCGLILLIVGGCGKHNQLSMETESKEKGRVKTATKNAQMAQAKASGNLKKTKTTGSSAPIARSLVTMLALLSQITPGHSVEAKSLPDTYNVLINIPSIRNKKFQNERFDVYNLLYNAYPDDDRVNLLRRTQDIRISSEQNCGESCVEQCKANVRNAINSTEDIKQALQGEWPPFHHGLVVNADRTSSGGIKVHAHHEYAIYYPNVTFIQDYSDGVTRAYAWQVRSKGCRYDSVFDEERCYPSVSYESPQDTLKSVMKMQLTLEEKITKLEKICIGMLQGDKKDRKGDTLEQFCLTSGSPQLADNVTDAALGFCTMADYLRSFSRYVNANTGNVSHPSNQSGRAAGSASREEDRRLAEKRRGNRSTRHIVHKKNVQQKRPVDRKQQKYGSFRNRN